MTEIREEKIIARRNGHAQDKAEWPSVGANGLPVSLFPSCGEPRVGVPDDMIPELLDGFARYERERGLEGFEDAEAYPDLEAPTVFDSVDFGPGNPMPKSLRDRLRDGGSS